MKPTNTAITGIAITGCAKPTISTALNPIEPPAATAGVPKRSVSQPASRIVPKLIAPPTM